MTSVCAAWANSGEDPQKCENILNSMQHLYENGNATMKPSRVAFGAVVNAWSKAGNVERAEAIVNHMEQLQGQDYEEMAPNHVIYNSLISAYANSRKVDVIDRVESILQKMLDMKSKGKLDASPTRITFNSVLSVYQRSIHVQNVLDKATKLINEMESVSRKYFLDALSPFGILFD
jgi:pentatricopeptide repeat protein